MYKLRFRQVHLDFHTSPDIPEIGVKFDKKQWQDRLKKAHVNSITCFSSCHHGMSYHPTKVGMMHPNLKFNLLRAQMDASKEINVNVPVYMTAGVNNYAAAIHPEWREINSDGTYAGWVKSPLKPGFMKMCFNTPYLDYLCDMIRETVSMFPEANGIFLDIISQGPCCCPWCLKSMYREGFDPQLEADRIAHARKVLLNYYKRTFEAVRSVDPKMPIFHNSGDIRIGDHEILPYFSHLELESLPTGGWGYDHYPMSAAYSRNLGLDFLGMTGKFHKTWGEFGGFKHPNALRYECAAMIANNSKCSVGDQLHPSGELDESTYEIIGEAYSHVEQCEPWCTDAESAAEIAVVADENTEHKQNSNVGASRLLLELHLPFDFVDSGMEFGKYKCLVVANETELTETLQLKLKMFLSNGGKVVFAGDSLFDKETGKPVFDIGAEFGARSPFCPDFVKCADDMVSFVKTPFVMRMPSRRMKVTTGHSLGKVYDPYFNRDVRHFCSHQYTPYETTPSGYDAAVISGNILYFAHPVFSLYRATGAVVLQKYVEKALELFLGDSRQVISENFPSTGRVTLMHQPAEKRHILHVLYANTILRGGDQELINFQHDATPTEVIEELLPLRNVSFTVRVPGPVTSVTREPEGTPIPFEYQDGKLRFSIDEFTCHTMVVIR